MEIATITIRDSDSGECLSWSVPAERLRDLCADAEMLRSHLSAGEQPILASEATTELSLIPFLAESGGLRDDGDLRAMDCQKVFVPGVGTLIRKAGGRSLDYARELAEERGYLATNSTVADLLDAIDAERHGRKVYPWGGAL